MDSTLPACFGGFADLVNTTLCPYAVRALIKYLPEPYAPGSTNFLDSVYSHHNWFTDPLTDAVVIAIRLADLGDDIYAQASVFSQIIELISDVFVRENIQAPGWQAQVADTRVFASFFSPIYPATNPRGISKGDYAFIMLQPEHSFHRVLPRSRLDPNQRTQIKASIRKSFEAAGKPYDALDRDPPTEAQKYVKPLNLADPAIEWWRL